MNQMEIAERLQMIIKLNKLTNAAFADRIGVQRSSISHVLAGRNKPSIDFIQKIITHFPNVDTKWLITGKQPKTKTPPPANSTTLSDTAAIMEDEDLPIYGQKERREQRKTDVMHKEKRIEKIVVFYDDGTFEETAPR